MNDLEKGIIDIENNLENIAYAVSCAFFKPDNHHSFKSFYDNYYKQLKRSKYFIAKNKPYRNKYEKSVKDLVDQLSEILGFRIKLFSANNNLTMIVMTKNKSNYINQEIFQIYKKDKTKYDALGINIYSLSNVYLEKGIEGIKKVQKLINQIYEKLYFYDLKAYLYSVKEFFEINSINKNMSRLFKKYNINNFNELLMFNTQIDSFLISTDNMNEKQKQIIENNRDEFRKKANLDKDFMLSSKEANKIKNKINKFYNSNFYEQILKNTNMDKFYEINNIKFSDFDLKELFNYYIYLNGSRAFAIALNIRGRKTDVCFLQSYILNEEALGQNTTILHECIHFLQSRSVHGNDALSVYCKYMTEAMTQYFAMEAQKHLKNDILTISNPNRKYAGSIYDCMLPLVKKLVESNVWCDFVSAYWSNETGFLADKIGDSNLSKIKECFDVVFSNRESNDIERIISNNAERVEKIVSNIKKIKR